MYIASILANAFCLTFIIAAFIALPFASLQINNRCMENRNSKCYENLFGVNLAMLIIGVISNILCASYFIILPININGGFRRNNDGIFINENLDRISMGRQQQQNNDEVNLRNLNINIELSKKINDDLNFKVDKNEDNSSLRF